MAFGLAVYASQDGLPRHHARLASGRWSGATGRAFHPQGSYERFQSCFLTSHSPFPSFAWHNHIDRSEFRRLDTADGWTIRRSLAFRPTAGGEGDFCNCVIASTTTRFRHRSPALMTLSPLMRASQECPFDPTQSVPVDTPSDAPTRTEACHHSGHGIPRPKRAAVTFTTLRT
jgi:hypothetical protein